MVLFACAHGTDGVGRNAFVGRGALLLTVQPSDAEIYIDDRYRGTIDDTKGRRLRLAEGERRVEIRRSGYFSAFRELQIARGVTQHINVTLRPIPLSDVDAPTTRGESAKP